MLAAVAADSTCWRSMPAHPRACRKGRQQAGSIACCARVGGSSIVLATYLTGPGKFSVMPRQGKSYRTPKPGGCRPPPRLNPKTLISHSNTQVTSLLAHTANMLPRARCSTPNVATSASPAAAMVSRVRCTSRPANSRLLGSEPSGRSTNRQSGAATCKLRLSLLQRL